MPTERKTAHRASRPGPGVFAIVTAGLLAGACANTGPNLLQTAMAPAGSGATSAAPQTELAKATEYWQKRHQKKPHDLKAALSYARNLKAGGNKKAAMDVLHQASLFHGQDKELASEYGRLALELGNAPLAKRLLAAADDPARRDWKTVAARGVALAKSGDYDGAIPLLKQAQALAPDKLSIANNLAMAYVATGDLTRAETLLRDIALRPDATRRMRQNLSLVLGLQGRYTEAKAIAAEDAPSERAYSQVEQMKTLNGTMRRGIAPGSQRSSRYAQSR